MQNKNIIYQLAVDGQTADVTIYGDIAQNAAVIRKLFGDDVGVVSAYDIKKEISDLNVKTINVYINSYGGEVAEALAIYTTLQRHPAKIHTFCDGFACSAASIVFCAGSQRTMGKPSLLMIHDAMVLMGYANSKELRKAADDAEKITQSSVEAYKAVSNLTEKQIKKMMEQETWMTAEEAKKYGFATDIADRKDDGDNPQQSAFLTIRNAVIESRKQSAFRSTDPIEPNQKNVRARNALLLAKAVENYFNKE